MYAYSLDTFKIASIDAIIKYQLFIVVYSMGWSLIIIIRPLLNPIY